MRGTALTVFFLLCSVVSLPSMGFQTNKKVIAHRGLSAHYPENTLISFRRALDTKAAYVELDVHLSVDDIPVVIHDEDLSRTTNGHGRVRDYPLFALKQLFAGFFDKFGTRYAKEKIPTLEEVLDLVVGESDKTLLIEIKYRRDDAEYRERVGRIVYETVVKNYRHKLGQIAFISFDHFILEKIREIDSDVRLGPIFHKLPRRGSLADQAIKLDTDIVIFSKKLVTSEAVFDKTDRVKHFVYTLLPHEFETFSQYEGLYGFATDFSEQIE